MSIYCGWLVWRNKCDVIGFYLVWFWCLIMSWILSGCVLFLSLVWKVGFDLVCTSLELAHSCGQVKMWCLSLNFVQG